MRRIVRHAKLSEHAQRLSGEGLIQLNQIHIVDIESRPLQHFTHRRYRPQPHQPRFDPCRRHRHDTRARREPLDSGLLFAGDDQRRGAIVDAGSIARGNDAALAERRFQFRQLLKLSVPKCCAMSGFTKRQPMVVSNSSA